MNLHSPKKKKEEDINFGPWKIYTAWDYINIYILAL